MSQEKHIHKSIFLNEKKYLLGDSYWDFVNNIDFLRVYKILE